MNIRKNIFEGILVEEDIQEEYFKYCDFIILFEGVFLRYISKCRGFRAPLVRPGGNARIFKKQAISEH